MRKFRLSLFIVFCSIGLSSQADDRFGTIGIYSVEADYQFGRIIPHDSKFTTPITKFTHAGEFSFYKQTLGKKPWQRKLLYPEIGGSFTFVYNGDQKIFGNVYMGMMLVKFWLVRSKYVDFFLRLSTGIALAPTHYNLITDPQNVVIGSTINTGDEVRLGLDFKPDPHVFVMLGICFTHYSNGRTQIPNLGVNVPAATVGIRYFPKVSADYQYNHDAIPKPVKRDEVMARFSYGSTSVNAAGGPKYPVYIGTVNYAHYTSICNKILAGVTVEYNLANYDYMKIQEISSKYGLAGSSTTLGIFAGDEILIGRVGLYFALGHALFNPPKSFQPFTKLGLDYYFVDVGKRKTTRFFAGIGVKTIYFVAQFAEASAGVAF